MDWKDKLGALLPDNFIPEPESEKAESSSVSPGKQTLRIEMEKRRGKPATIISGFEGSDDELKELAKELRNNCASGGSQRDGEILIQGDFRVKVAELLQAKGFKIRKINF